MKTNQMLVEFGSRLLRARLNKRLSQREFAEAIGASHGAISGYENGTNDPRMSLVVKMADVLGVSVSWLVTGERDNVVALGDNPERAEKIRRYIHFLDYEENRTAQNQIRNSKTMK